MASRDRRTVSVLISSMIVFAIAGCSFKSGLGDAACSEEGARDGNRVCHNGYWVGVGSDVGGADVPWDGSGECEPSNEVCNGDDDDCDGVTDEGCGCHYQDKNTGVCTDGTRKSDGTCEPPETYSMDESAACTDRLDNDCDGKTDGADGDCVCSPGETQKCYTGPMGTAGKGICSEGTQKCDGGQWGACEGDTTPEESDTCGDGVDNDCDGEADNDCTCNFEGKAEGVCKGVEPEPNGDCPQPAGWEMPTDNEAQCDSKDNDCDGATDEGCGCNYDGKSDGVCGEATRDENGECQKPMGYEQPTDEESHCDGQDNDCDGERDEDCDCSPPNTKSCYTGRSGTAGTGICKSGTLTCQQDGTWTACQGETTPKSKESCNQKDDDCDGTTDEGCPCDYNGHATGVCANSTRNSQGNCTQPSDWIAMTGDEKPECDNKDNDCDGDTDEQCECVNQNTQSCGTDKGICSSGTQTCTGGTWGNCMGNTTGSSEVCEGSKDEDCDGNTDENCNCTNGTSTSCYTGPGGTKGTGICHGGMKTCAMGQWGSCMNQQTPNSESCGDSKDNDCDGATDENCPCNYNSDSQGVCGNATRDSQGMCQQPSDWMGDTGDETPNCDGKDNDCDGNTDEGCVCIDGMSRTCYTGPSSTRNTGICSDGTESCANGTWGSCTGETTPNGSETCGDAKDNDCDGSTNENCTCNYRGINQGVCAGLDENDQGNCPQPTDLEQPETSCEDGKDNDCDGHTDGTASKDGGASCNNDCDCYSGYCKNGSCVHRVFATSSTWDGDFGGTTQADSLCQTAANNAGLNGTWKAIISVQSDEAVNRISLGADVYNMDGQLVDSQGGFWGLHNAPIRYDENGKQVGDRAWTGTDENGQHDGDNEGDSGEDCSGWTTNDSGTHGEAGRVDRRGYLWASNDQRTEPNCSKKKRLYCIDGQ